MQVILLKSVSKLGVTGSVVKVKNGFGRNYLIPNAMAMIATKSSILSFENQKIDLLKQEEFFVTKAQDLALTLDNKELIFVRQAAEDGRLFGSVSAKEIAKQFSEKYLSKDHNHTIKSSHILLAHPIKTTGSMKVKITLYHDVEIDLLVIVGRTLDEAYRYKEEALTVKEPLSD